MHLAAGPAYVPLRETGKQPKSYTVSRSVKPRADQVLAAIRPGRMMGLGLTRGQRWLLRDPDGLIALDVLGHVLEARRVLGAPADTPLTAHFVQSAAAKLSHRVGVKRCGEMVKRLYEALLMDGVGEYRQRYHDDACRSGFKVKLWRLARLPNSGRVRGFSHRRRESKHTVGRTEAVKRGHDPRFRNPGG